jgi:glutathione S-transferase
MNLLLRYFDARGRAEPLRVALTDSGLPFEDDRVSIDLSKWPALKAQRALSGPLGHLPILVWDGFEVAETFAIASYLAHRLGHYEGLSSEERARIEMVVSFVYLDLMNAAGTMIWVPPGTDVQMHVKALAGRLKRRPAQLEALLGEESVWFGGARPVMADYFAASAMRTFELVFGEKAKPILAACPRVARLMEETYARPLLARYLAEGREPPRVTASPGESEMLALIRELA